MNKRLQIYLFAIIALFSTSIFGMQITYTTTVKDEKLNDRLIKRIFTTTSNLHDWELKYHLFMQEEGSFGRYAINGYIRDTDFTGAAIFNMLFLMIRHPKQIVEFEFDKVTISRIADEDDLQHANPQKLLQLKAQQQAPAQAAAAAAPIHPAQQAEAAPAQQESIMGRFIAVLMGRQQQAPAHAAAAPIHPAQQAAAAEPVQAERAPNVARAILGAPGGPKIEEKKEEEPSN